MAPFWIVLAVIGATVLLLTMSHDSGQTLGMQSDQFASMVYLSLWAAVIAVGILGSRSRMRHSLRDLAYWLLLVVVLMTGYQYRYELQDGASRLTAGLIPGSPLALRGDTITSVMLFKANNGHFEARATINDKTVQMMVDTGATSNVLTYEDAIRSGIAVENLQFVHPVMTANGRAMAAQTKVETIAVGDIVRHNVNVLVAAEGNLSQSLLGMQFLGTLSSVEIRGDRLILRD